MGLRGDPRLKGQREACLRSRNNFGRKHIGEGSTQHALGDERAGGSGDAAAAISDEVCAACAHGRIEHAHIGEGNAALDRSAHEREVESLEQVDEIHSTLHGEVRVDGAEVAGIAAGVEKKFAEWVVVSIAAVVAEFRNRFRVEEFGNEDARSPAESGAVEIGGRLRIVSVGRIDPRERCFEGSAVAAEEFVGAFARERGFGVRTNGVGEQRDRDFVGGGEWVAAFGDQAFPRNHELLAGDEDLVVIGAEHVRNAAGHEQIRVGARGIGVRACGESHEV